MTRRVENAVILDGRAACNTELGLARMSGLIPDAVGSPDDSGVTS